jgi:hypothetical protein
MPFDPTQPFERITEGGEPQFDPSQPFEIVSRGEPTFDPSQPYERIEAPGLLDRIKAALAPGLESLGRAMEADSEANAIAGQALRDAGSSALDFAKAAFSNASQGAQLIPGPVPGSGVANFPRFVGEPLKPLVQLPRMDHRPEAGATEQAVRGAVNVAAGVAEGVLTPVGIVTLGAGPALSAGAHRLLAGAFGLDMARHVPEAAAQVGQAIEEGSLQQKVEAVGGLAATAGMAGLATKHAVTPARITAARGVASQLERAELAPGAVTQGARMPEARVEPVNRVFEPAEVLEATDALIDAAPRVLRDEVAAAPMAPERVVSRSTAIREAAETRGAEGALEAIVDASPDERAAAAIAMSAGDDLARAVRSRRVKPDAAEAIGRAAPGDANSQSIGMAAVREGATPEQAGRAVRAFREQFGATDAADVIADPIEMARLRSAAPMGSPAAPAGLPSGTTPVTGSRMPVSVNPVVKGRQDVPGVMAQLERVMAAAGTRTPIRVGRMGPMKRWASGFFRPHQEVIRLDSASNIPTATHEVAHALAKEFWSRQAGTSNASGVLRRAVPKDVAVELRNLGVKLYGSRRPAAGYIEEGWSEFVRHYLSTDAVATEAPKTLAWFNRDVAPKFPEVMKELRVARDKIDVYRGQGQRNRSLAMMKSHPGRLAQLKKKVGKVLSVKAQVEQLTPLEQASRFWQERAGKALPPGQDPYLVASRVRGIAPTVLTRFVESGPIDLHGNRTGGVPLADVLAPILKDISGWQRAVHAVVPKLARQVQERVENFSLYLWARRTIERAGKGQETGMTLDDARGLISDLGTPQFQMAADRYYRWWDDVLDYYGQAGPANAELVRAIRAGSADYVPLPRVFESVGGRSQSGHGGGLYRMHGSGRPIYDVMESTLRAAGSLIEKAHRDLVANSVIDLAQREGMGWLVEKVPVDKVRESVSVGKIRAELEAMGVDLSMVADDVLVEYYTEARSPNGVDAVYPRKAPGAKQEWYVLDPATYEILAGVDSPRVAAGILAGSAAWTTRTFKMGTVGLRASFQMVTNTLRDSANFMIQSGGNPARAMGAYFASMGDMIRAGLQGVSGGKIKPSEWWNTLEDLGVPMSNSIAHDIVQTRSAIRGAYHGRGMRIISEPVNAYRELISGFESVPREAALRIKAAEMGWRPGMKLTPDQAVALTVAAKRVTTDFTAGGSVSRQANLYIPFYNVSIQGMRTAARTLRSAVDPAHAERNLTTQRVALGRVAIGGTFLAGLTLANWLRNRDEEWYRAIPWRERFLYTHVLGPDGIVVRVPRPVEWGNLFMVLPEAIADSWYRDDPETAVKAIEHIVASMNPMGLPVPISAALEQAANRDFFWDRPIVPRGEIDLPPGEQRSEYTSWLAKALGDAFPDTVSPRRVDAAIRQFGGGAAGDFVAAVGLENKIHGREWEPADAPIVGTLFRRGGAFTAANRHINEFHDLYSFLAARARSKARPMDPNEESFWKRIRQEKEQIDFVREIAIRTKELEPRQRLWREAGERARVLNERAKNQGIRR